MRPLVESAGGQHMVENARVQIRGKGWTKATTIDAKKYEVMSNALLASLTSEPVPFTKLVEKVAQRLPGFEGSISWYAITCARELEVQGKLVRQEKPVRYLKVGAVGARSKAAQSGTAKSAA